MNTINKNSVQDIAVSTFIISIFWLALTFYLECYWLFDQWHLSAPFTDKLLFRLRNTGWLEPGKGRWIALFFLLISFAGASDGKPATLRLLVSGKCLLFGFFLYFSVAAIFIPPAGPMLACMLGMLFTTGGYILIRIGGMQFVRILRLRWIKGEDPFGREQGGFPQQEQRTDSEFSLHLRGEYEYMGEKKECWINLLNPRRGIFILGSPGSGKSRFIIEPLLRQWMKKGNTLFLYDFKYDALTRLAYEYFGRYRHCYPANAEFYSINFTDLSRSHRCNLLDPSTLHWLSDALGASRTILLSMNPTWVNRQGEFFAESPVNFLAAIIWWLKKYSDGQYCTLPHAIELAQLPYDKLFTLLNTEGDIQSLINPFIVAYRNKTFEMLDSQITSAKVPLARLASPNVYYILTGNDLSLDINDPAAPKVVCLGGDPSRQEALGPVLSLYIDRVNALCNRPGRAPLGIFCDEFATVRAYSMATAMATGRSNDIVPLIAVQDLNQLRIRYSREEAEVFMAISGNLFCGQIGGETADWVTKRFPMIQKERASVSANDNGGSVTTSQHWEPTMTAATIAGLSSGEFVGMVADDPGNEIELKAFHARLKREQADGVGVRAVLPVLRKKADEAATEAFARVKKDIQELAQKELMVLVGDPGKAGLLIK